MCKQRDEVYLYMPFTFCSSGFLWELWPLLHGAEPAASTYRGSLHPPAATGLAHPHRHEDGAVDVHEQVCVRCTQSAFSPHRPSFPCQPAACQRGTLVQLSEMTFISSVCPSLFSEAQSKLSLGRWTCLVSFDALFYLSLYINTRLDTFFNDKGDSRWKGNFWMPVSFNKATGVKYKDLITLKQFYKKEEKRFYRSRRVKSNELVLFEIYCYICKHEYSKTVKHSFVGLRSHVNALSKKKSW